MPFQILMLLGDQESLPPHTRLLHVQKALALVPALKESSPSDRHVSVLSPNHLAHLHSDFCFQELQAKLQDMEREVKDLLKKPNLGEIASRLSCL